MNRRIALAIALVLAGCATQKQQAPVIERAPNPAQRAAPPASTPAKAAKKAVVSGEKDWRPDSYVVKKGDTLYALGLEFGFDYKDIARWNDIEPPYVIKVGRKLKLKESGKPAEPVAVAPANDGAVVTPMKTESAPQPKPIGENTAKAEPKASGEAPLKTEPKATKEPWSEQAPAPAEKPAEKVADKTPPVVDDEAIEWAFPTQGKVIAGFGDSKGLDIAGDQGQPILAAAPGKVVYSGSGLRGYGKLVIIKHNKTYLSAYAHNSQILAKEGQEVTKGQKIAEMGNTDADKVKLHFEIRKLGKPVDPANYFPKASN